MAMKLLREGAKGGLGKFILVGFMALAVGGLVLMDMGGFFRGGITQTDVAKAGKQTISMNRFDRAVRRTLGPLGLSPEEAYKVGYIDQILKMELRASLINQAARKAGIRIDDAYVAQHIKKLVAPVLGEGENPKTALERILFNQGMSEGEFVAALKGDMASSLLTSALQTGFSYVDDRLARYIYNHQNETRTVEYIVLPDSGVEQPESPSDEELRALYEINQRAYAIPETRHLKLIAINQDKLESTIDITEDVLKQNYEDNIDFYSVNAAWMLDQALMNTQEQAQDVLENVQNGQGLKTAVKNATGNENAYLGEKSFEDGDLPDDIKDDVLTAKKDSVLGPIESPLGWYVIKVKAADPARTKSFEEVKADIKKDLLDTQLVDILYEHANIVDDLLAGGASIEEVANESDVTIIDLPLVNRRGRTKDGENPLKDFGELRARILEDGFNLTENETSPMQEMPDGRFMAVHVAAITPLSYTPFEEVQDDLRNKWIEDNRRIANKTRTYGLAERLKTETLADLAKSERTPLKTIRSVGRAGTLPDGFMPQAMSTIFGTLPNEPVVLETDDGLALAVVTNVEWPNTVNDDDLQKLKADLAITQQNEAITLYLSHKQKEYGIDINRKLIDRMYGGYEP